MIKITKISPAKFDKLPQHRPRILKCKTCQRKFADETARSKHYKDKKH
jgi:hypothetical protein